MVQQIPNTFCEYFKQTRYTLNISTHISLRICHVQMNVGVFYIIENIFLLPARCPQGICQYFVDYSGTISRFLSSRATRIGMTFGVESTFDSFTPNFQISPPLVGVEWDVGLQYRKLYELWEFVSRTMAAGPAF